MCDFVSQNQKLFDELDNLIDSLEVADEGRNGFPARGGLFRQFGK